MVRIFILFIILRNIYISCIFILRMKKRGISTVTSISITIILLVVIGIVISAVTVLIINKAQESSQEDDAQDGNADTSQAGEAGECRDYISQGDCESDLENAGNSDQVGWTELNCALEEVNCVCNWNEGESLCELALLISEGEEANETEENNESGSLDNLLFDLEAFNLSLVNDDCKSSNITNDTFCNMSVSGIIKNVGSGAIDKEFLVKFIDGGDTYHIINLFTVNTIESGAEKTFSFVYKNILKGTYWIQIKVDSRNDIEETNEENNEIVEMIEMK